MQNKIDILVLSSDKKHYNVSVSVPTAFGTYIETPIASNLGPAETDMLVAGIVAAFKAVGIIAEEQAL